MPDLMPSFVQESVDASLDCWPAEANVPSQVENTKFDRIAQEFLYPDNPAPHEFTRLAQKVIHALIDSLVGQASCFSGSSPSELRGLFEIDTTSRGIYSEGDLIGILQDIAHNSVNLASPKSLAYMSSTPLMLSVVADLAASILNQSLDTWDQSPAATEIERAVVRHIGDITGLPVRSGWMTPGGTLSNFQAIVLARDWKLAEFNHNKSESTSSAYTPFSRLRAFCCVEAHFSVEKGLHLAGLGNDALIKIPARNDGSIDTSILDFAINEQLRLGNIPFLIVGTAGTTNLGAIDDLNTLRNLAKKHSCWFHADAAHGGACLLSKTYHGLVTGLRAADSVALDGHKFLYQPISCGILLLLKNQIQTTIGVNHSIPYLSSSHILFEDAYDSYHETVLTTRRFDALKLYLCFRLLGGEFFSDIIDSRIRLAKWFWRFLRKQSGFEAIKPRLNIVVFRYQPSGTPNALADRINVDIWKNLFRSGKLTLSLTRWQERPFLRAVIMNPFTTRADLVKTVKLIRHSAAHHLRMERS